MQKPGQLIAFLIAVVALTWPTTGLAQRLRTVTQLPLDCGSLVDGTSARGLQDWRDLVRVEHCDRIKRLRRISAGLPADQQPIFYDGNVLTGRLPQDVGIDLPILRVVFPERVFFDTNSAALTPAAAQIVSIIAESLRNEPPDVVMFVAGHADARADRAYNARLSIDRANALAAAVLARGINLATVWRVGFGEDLPLFAGDTDYAYGQNRRIEFLFAARAEALASWLADQQLDQLCQGRSQTDTAECLRQLDLDDPYDVIQLRSAEVPRATPSRTPPRRVDSSSRPARSATVAETEATAIAPGSRSGQRLDPTPAPTIRLNLRRRSQGRIY